MKWTRLNTSPALQATNAIKLFLNLHGFVYQDFLLMRMLRACFIISPARRRLRAARREAEEWVPQLFNA